MSSTAEFIEVIKSEVSEDVFTRIWSKAEPLIEKRLFNNSFNLKGAAKYVGASEDFMRILCRKKRIRFYKVGNEYRLRQSVLDDWMHAQEQDNYCETE
ncbi:excisionase family DNA-binding protein [Paenibacillus sp. 2TAB23]|uniref:excisionase family DNA-binding protein n=1 Tax=Paenibacillus sp. 2TAB23 TaxID=3233004 RepID=UPI003F9AA0CF